MLLNLTHRVLFVRPAKVGGTSVEMFLQKTFWPDAAVEHEQPPLVRADGLTTARMRPWEAPTRRQSLTGRLWALRYPSVVGPRGIDVADLWNHSLPTHIRSVVGERCWQRVHRVSIVRNLYDVEVSRYFWRNRGALPAERKMVLADFERFVVTTAPAKSNAGVIDSLDDFDTILNYETLASDVDAFIEEIGLKRDNAVRLPTEKSGLRPEWAADYRVMYSTDARQAVEHKYKDQLKRLGMTFEG